MARQAEYGANSPYLIDFIPITLKVKFVDLEKIRQMYVDQGLSAAQIGKHFQVSRIAILARLHDLGLKETFSWEKNKNPLNYRCAVAPYGYQVELGKLIPHKREQIICRRVVGLIERQGKSHSEVARELTQRGFKNRAGSLTWDSKTIFNIYKRWRGKV